MLNTAVCQVRTLAHRNLIWVLIALFVASVAIRAIFLVAVSGPDRPLEGDEGAYHEMGAAFARGEWMSTSERPPFPGYQLMWVYMFTGPDPAAGRWATVLYSSLGAPLLFLTVRMLFRRRGEIALLAAGAWVIYPPSIWYAGWLFTETASALLVVSSLGAFLWAATSKAVWPVLLTGALWAFLALTRSTFLLLPVALLVGQLAVSRFGPIEWSWSPRRWALGFVAFAVVMTPWTVHNFREHGVFMPHSTQGGTLLMHSNGTLSDPAIQAGGYYKNPDLMYHPSLVGKSEVEQDGIRRRLALEEIKTNWRLLPRPILNRAKNFWTTRPDPYDSTWTTNDWIMLIIWGPVLVFFVTSSFVRSWRESWPVTTIILYAFLLTLPFWGTPRFRFPVDALIVTAAAVGFVGFLGFVSSAVDRWRRAGGSGWFERFVKSASNSATGHGHEPRPLEAKS